MTESELRSRIANWATQFVGCKEGDAQHLKILAILNDSGLCSRYKMTPKDSWCATTVSAAFISYGLAGAPGSGKLFECVECSCGNMITLAKKQGIWVENDSYVPEVGDIIMYDWDDNGVGDCTGWPEHVGIVYRVNGNSIRVIEGNISNSVGYRDISVNAKYIRGYITPKYSRYGTNPTPNTTAKLESTTTTVKPTTITTTAKPLNKVMLFKAKVTANTGLIVRSGAGTQYTRLRALPKNTIIEVYEIKKDLNGNEWYSIKESGKTGYVASKYTTKYIDETTTGRESRSLNKTCKFKGKVTALTGLNVRAWAGSEHSKLNTLSRNTEVNVCDTVKDSKGHTWYYIRYNSKYGFCDSTYIKKI